MERKYDLVISKKEIRSIKFERILEISVGSGGIKNQGDNVVNDVYKKNIKKGKEKEKIKVNENKKVKIENIKEMMNYEVLVKIKYRNIKGKK